MNVRSISKVSALAILGLTLALMLPATATPKLSLRTQFFSQPVTFSPWQNTVTLDTTAICPQYNEGAPFTIGIQGKNFTENLSGRDSGSTFIQFRGLEQNSYLLRASDLTALFLAEFICSTLGGDTSSIVDLLNRVQAFFLHSSGSWRVPLSGNYVMLPQAGFWGSWGPPPPFTLVANETWTVTAIV